MNLCIGDPQQPDSAGGICVNHESVHSSGDSKFLADDGKLEANRPWTKMRLRDEELVISQRR